MSWHARSTRVFTVILLVSLFPLTAACHKGVQPAAAGSISSLTITQNRTDTAAERVSFPSLDRDKPVMISGLFFKPKHSGTAPVPAVVALHGCGGMYSSSKTGRDRLSARHQAMAEMLLAEGYAVLFPDSFRSRGIEEICTTRSKDRTLTEKQRTLDAQGALAWLQGRNDIKPDRIAVLGWSHGGSTTLSVLNTREKSVKAWKQSGSPYFRAGAMFYPGCRIALRSSGYALTAPTTMFVGASDDWTPPQPCIELADNLKSNAENIAITVYPHTYHGFDGPTGQSRKRMEVPNGVNPGHGVTVAANPDARRDAYERLKSFLRRHLLD